MQAAKRRVWLGILIVALAVAVGALLTTPGALKHVPSDPTLDDNLQGYLDDAEARVAADTAIIAGAEKRIRWYDGNADRRTPLALVYLHGFSATRQEIAPVGERIADALGANLFETRLAGHGLETGALTNVSAEQWLDDAAEALAVGTAIGERILLVGTSTGATLALAARDLAGFEKVAALVLVSPNFAPKDGAAEWLLKPYGPQLGRLVAGGTRTWTAANPEQARYWTTSYPLDAAVEMMRLVGYVRDRLPMSMDAPLLVLYSPDDAVIDVAAIHRSVGQIDTPDTSMIEVADVGDLSNHVLAGDILSPETNDTVAQHVIGFVRGSAR